MKTNEIKFLIVLLFLTSIIINIFLTIGTTDFYILDLCIKSEKCMNAYINMDFNALEKYINTNQSFDEFKNDQESVVLQTGKVTSYALSDILSNFVRKGDTIELNYSVQYENEVDWDKASVVFRLNHNQWFLDGFRFTQDGKEVIIKDNREAEKNKTIEQAIKASDDILVAYNDRKPDYIYSSMTNKIKEDRSLEDFRRYLDAIWSEYGPLTNYLRPQISFSADNSELQLTYTANCKNFNGNIQIIVWIKADDSYKVSGIKFLKNAW